MVYVAVGAVVPNYDDNTSVDLPNNMVLVNSTLDMFYDNIVLYCTSNSMCMMVVEHKLLDVTVVLQLSEKMHHKTQTASLIVVFLTLML